jgi:glycosyltransferase involved in cell wall biosynthesis
MSDTPLVSIVIPSYNEERDILACVQAARGITYPHTEIIVVDSSNDRTPELLRPLAEAGAIRLIHEDRRLSVSAARNRGIRVAKGDIVVLLNADVVPSPDFIHRILPHYRDGADFVICESEVANQGKVIPDFLHAVHVSELGSENDLVWSEGWSCRRSVFDRAGVFDEQFPGASGEDEAFGRGLLGMGFRRIVDHSVPVRHITPEDVGGFLRQMAGRGRGEYYFTLLFRHRDPAPVVRRFLGRWISLVALPLAAPVFPWGTVLASAGLLLVGGRAIRSGARLSRVHGGPARALPFALLNFLRFRAIEYGFVLAHWRAERGGTRQERA